MPVPQLFHGSIEGRGSTLSSFMGQELPCLNHFVAASFTNSEHDAFGAFVPPWKLCSQDYELLLDLCTGRNTPRSLNQK
jgi:hypothetical protein